MSVGRGTLVAAVSAVVVVAGTGCTATGITPERIEAAFAPTFARLYVRQQHLEGRTDVPSTAAMATTGDCTRGDAADPDLGAGNDWACTIRFLISGPGTPVSLTYTLTVRPDGCYTAEDPPIAMGRQTIVTATGTTVTNPVFAIDGCFPTS